MADKVEVDEDKDILQEEVQNEETTENEETAQEDTAKEEKAPAKETKTLTPEEIADELKIKLLRTRADFDNFRKRTQKDLADARAYSKMSTVEDILPIVDTFKMALMSVNAENVDVNKIVTGLNMIQSQFDQVFSGMGINEIEAVGKEFDHHLHEAVAHEFSEEIEANFVISQHRCGFKLGERLLRPATVVVSKGPQTDEESEDK
ncbi:MAG: nucleotide exchange factor GrpE [Lentisphaeraceae bacterium]|nr:nucleotide exchange factor GrpE [Lentisphaeraceae bacterium]